MIKLKKVDIEMLKLLFMDGRKDFRKIAQEINAPEDTVRKRYKELKKAGLIVGATAQIDYQKLGYTGITSTLIRVDSEKILETMDRIAKIPEMRRWLYRTYGSTYNIANISVLKDIKHLEFIKQTIFKENQINAFQNFIWTDIRNSPERIPEFCEEDVHETPHRRANYSNNRRKCFIDEFDEKIIDILFVNGRLSFKKISEKIGLSTQSVARRYRNLKDNGLIRVSIQINPVLLGLVVVGEFLIALNDPQKRDEAAEKISNIRGIYIVVKTIGNFDIDANFLVKNFDEYIELQKRICDIVSARNLETIFSEPFNQVPTPAELITTF